MWVRSEDDCAESYRNSGSRLELEIDSELELESKFERVRVGGGGPTVIFKNHMGMETNFIKIGYTTVFLYFVFFFLLPNSGGGVF